MDRRRPGRVGRRAGPPGGRRSGDRLRGDLVRALPERPVRPGVERVRRGPDDRVARSVVGAATGAALAHAAGGDGAAAAAGRAAPHGPRARPRGARRRRPRPPAGRQDLFGGRGVVRVDQLRLRSPAPQPAPSPSTAGSVLAPGHPGDGERDGVRLDVRRPGWLVDGESYNRGWRATCDGRSLGAPVPMQGYANAWRVRPGCRNVDVAFAPDRVLPWG